jgi:hypothetical protein
MKYTAVFIDGLAPGGYATRFFIASHDKNVAWGEIESQVPVGLRLLFILPGEQLVYSQSDICFGNSVG